MARIAIQRGRLIGGTISCPKGGEVQHHGEWQAEVVQRSAVRVTVYRHPRKLPYEKAAALLDKVCEVGTIDPTCWERLSHAPYESDYFGWS